MPYLPNDKGAHEAYKFLLKASAEFTRCNYSKLEKAINVVNEGCVIGALQEEKEAALSEEAKWSGANRQREMLVFYPRNALGGSYDNPTLSLAKPITYHNIQDLLARFFIGVHALYGVMANWRQQVIGCTSRYGDQDEHMPMFDYDGKNVKKVIRKDVKLLQKKYGLGNAWVYETRRGFHVYFFCDKVNRVTFFSMLEDVQCCKGFKKATRGGGRAVLRVSAKYTEFDIAPLYVLAAKDNKLRRMTSKAHTIRALIDLGQQCGTHFASLFPQWAHFQEDLVVWKPPVKEKKQAAKNKHRRKGVRIRKIQKSYSVRYGAKDPKWNSLPSTTPTGTTSAPVTTSVYNPRWCAGNKSSSEPF